MVVFVAIIMTGEVSNIVEEEGRACECECVVDEKDDDDKGMVLLLMLLVVVLLL